jgi:hypothetical protein
VTSVIEATVGGWQVETMIEVPAVIEDVAVQGIIVFGSASDLLETDSDHDVETRAFLSENAMVENDAAVEQKEAKASS